MDVAGAVEQHVDRGLGRRQPCYGAVVAHVEPAGDDPRLLLRQRGQARLVDVGGDDPGARPGKGDRGCPADAVGSRGDDGALVRQPIGHEARL